MAKLRGKFDVLKTLAMNDDIMGIAIAELAGNICNVGRKVAETLGDASVSTDGRLGLHDPKTLDYDSNIREHITKVVAAGKEKMISDDLIACPILKHVAKVFELASAKGYDDARAASRKENGYVDGPMASVDGSGLHYVGVLE